MPRKYLCDRHANQKQSNRIKKSSNRRPRFSRIERPKQSKRTKTKSNRRQRNQPSRTKERDQPSRIRRQRAPPSHNSNLRSPNLNAAPPRRRMNNPPPAVRRTPSDARNSYNLRSSNLVPDLPNTSRSNVNRQNVEPEFLFPNGLSESNLVLQETGIQESPEVPDYRRLFPVITLTGISLLSPSPLHRVDTLAAGDGPYNNSMSFDIVPGTGDLV